MLKKNKFSGLFTIAILRKSSSYVTSYQDALVSFAFYSDSIRTYFTHLCFKNLLLRLSLCLCAINLLRDRLSTFDSQQAVWLCFPGMTSSLVKSKQIIAAHFSTLFSVIFSSLMFLNIKIDWIIIKTYDQQFTLTTKKSLHIIFKVFLPLTKFSI